MRTSTAASTQRFLQWGSFWIVTGRITEAPCHFSPGKTTVSSGSARSLEHVIRERSPRTIELAANSIVDLKKKKRRGGGERLGGLLKN